jgi:ABC-type polysaccharide/polyol phosphate export permease
MAIIAVYVVVFGIFMRRSFEGMEVPYPVFLVSGMIPWLAFQDCLSLSSPSFRRNRPYLRKLPVPEVVFIAEISVSTTLYLLQNFILVIVIAIIYGHYPTFYWLLLPLPLLFLQIIGFSIGLFLGTLSAFFPDVDQIVQIVLRLAIWTAPILFPLSFFTENGFGIIPAMNPITPVLIAIRDLFVSGQLPSFSTTVAILSWTVFFLFIAYLTYVKLQSEIRDVI